MKNLQKLGIAFLVLLGTVLLASCGSNSAGTADEKLSTGISSTTKSADFGKPASAEDIKAMSAKLGSYFNGKNASNPQALTGSTGSADSKSATASVNAASTAAPMIAASNVASPVFRFYNINTGAHFFTMSAAERDYVKNTFPFFTFEGNSFFAYPDTDPTLSPVYRFYNKVTGTHFFTISPEEKAYVQATWPDIFNYEGISWYASNATQSGWVPVYRFFNTKTSTHFYTTSVAERDYVQATWNWFTFEGIAYYVLQDAVAAQPIVYPTTTKEFKAPWELVSIGAGGLVNDDIVFGSTSDGISDDGSKVVFTSWSSHGFGLATKPCTFDWIYVRDIDKKILTLPVTGLDGKILCGYESSPSISGNGKFVVFRGILPPYSHSTSSVSGFFRTEIGTTAYEPVNRKGLEFSFENNGTLKVGTIIKGQSMRARPDTDGNSIVFSMKYLENTADVGRQYNSSLFANAMLRLDKGAQSVGNQSWAAAHDDTSLDYLNYEVSGDGTFVFYTELNAKNINIHRVWNMLSRNDEGDPFESFRTANPDANASMCGVSSDGRYVLVRHAFIVPLSSGRSLEKAGKIKIQLSRFDRINKVFEYAAVSEEQSRSINDGTCDYFSNGSFSRQMSKDGNRIFWRSGANIFVRDMTLQKTLKIPFPGVAYDWTISGNGKHVLLTTNIAPDGTKYLNKYGSATSQLYRFGPINDSDFGAAFTLDSFENKLNQ